ncbi:hypothetical protein KDJ56_21285 [Brevibacillus composti]|uniref:Preprotein translocase subunit Tim44 n=1 Tax=Brevibacillus composti TaxID=2796470 RepID=A0A7T5EKL4_9BACL|nr:hypothetical protein [Brevibacillus composti]QQE74333.1 hypothetical protein JD108_21350 [Brevibacillus composti]QUO41415.1 hypothetical protein KDJ56_21285 [Brevibacillus composti]
MKKLLMLLMAFALVFAPGGLDVDHADAKGYKSGKKSIAPTKTTPNKADSNVNATTNTNTNSTNATTPMKNTSTAAPSKGGFMKGLLVGGLAGLLFGSLFGDLGMLGSILGFMINVLALVVLFVVIRKVYLLFKNQRKKQELDPWKK